MKNITLIALVLLTILAGCKKDKAERNTDRIVGKWSLHTAAYVEYENDKETERNQRSNLNQICEFRSDGSATVNLEGDNAEVKWTATDNTFQLTTDRQDKLDFKIKSLSKSNLHIVFEDDVDVRNGITYKETVEFEMRKVD